MRRAAAREAVQPIKVTVTKNENILRRGDIVGEEDYEKLTKLGLVLVLAVASRSCKNFCWACWHPGC
jgi:membrane-associated HD superfamily phosphohydrolase